VSVWRVGADTGMAAERTRERRRAIAEEGEKGGGTVAAPAAPAPEDEGHGGAVATTAPPAAPPQPPAPAQPPAGTTLQNAIDRLTKWIPGDVLALYVAGVTALAAAKGARPSVALLLCFAVVALLWVPASAFASSGSVPKRTWIPAGLAAVAFCLWTLSVPFSGWQRWSFVGDNQAAVAIVAALLGIFFGFFADGVTKRYPPQ
jgi:hypothetical protein